MPPTTPTSASPRTSRCFVERTLTIGIGLLSAMVTLGSFVVILWTLSAAAPLHLFGTEWNIPGYLVWAALIYAVIGTVLTHLIGWPLVGAQFPCSSAIEADFRFNLVRVRENSEQIALLKGEAAENERLLRTLRPRGGELAADHEAHQEADVLHRGLFAGLDHLSLCRGQPRLLRRQDAARRTDADRIRLQQRADRRFRSSSMSTARWRNGASVIQRLDGFGAGGGGGAGRGAIRRR